MILRISCPYLQNPLGSMEPSILVHCRIFSGHGAKRLVHSPNDNKNIFKHPLKTGAVQFKDSAGFSI
jgi:hypothetical protein